MSWDQNIGMLESNRICTNMPCQYTQMFWMAGSIKLAS